MVFLLPYLVRAVMDPCYLPQREAVKVGIEMGWVITDSFMQAPMYMELVVELKSSVCLWIGNLNLRRDTIKDAFHGPD